MPWRDTANYPRLAGDLDARILAPMGIWLYHWSWATLWIAVAGCVFFWLLMRAGYKPMTFVRRLRRAAGNGSRRGRGRAIVQRRRMGL